MRLCARNLVFARAGREPGGYRLGSEDGPSEAVSRVLTFWRNGFSVDDGPLYAYDDPANSELLAAINSGQAPLHVLDVLPGQPVDVKVAKKQDEDYVPPKPVLKARVRALAPAKPRFFLSLFRGLLGFQEFLMTISYFLASAAALLLYAPGWFSRIGSGGVSRSAQPPPSASPAERNPAPAMSVDPSQPVTSLQIRLADGTRMLSKFNTTHTVADVRNFINAWVAA
ncbi:MAG: SEP domain-containing protein, partial [Olpidium bornovanus]